MISAMQSNVGGDITIMILVNFVTGYMYICALRRSNRKTMYSEMYTLREQEVGLAGLMM